MIKFTSILRDPNLETGGGGVPTPPDYSESNPPKTKAEWDGLADSNPKLWISLTQPRMDQAVREARTSNERLTATEQRYTNLETEFKTFKDGQQPPQQPPAEPAGDKPFSRENLPNSDEQWDNLFIENPTLATDLRWHKNQQDTDQTNNRNTELEVFTKERRKHAEVLFDRHTEMYVQENNSDGTPRVDEHGKPVLKIDPNTKGPIFDANSEKGKLWIEVYNEDPQGYDGSKMGPRLAMLEMERRLKERGEAQVNQGSQENQPGQSGGPAPDNQGTLPGGVPPPVKNSVKVSFKTDEEKTHAERAVQRGIYKDLQEYCSIRDGKQTGIEEEGRVPQFG